MRQITRTIAVALVLATTLTATTAVAAPSKRRADRDRPSITEVVQRLMKRIFGAVSANANISDPKPDTSNSADPSYSLGEGGN